MLLGDFNARVGGDSKIWGNVIGQYGVGKCNSNGLRLLRTCSEHNLLITNTVYRLPIRNRTSWMHPRSKHWHLIDYVIVRKRDRQDVLVTKAMCGAECWTDHRLIVSKVKLQIQPKRRPQGAPAPKRLNVIRLKSEDTRSEFVSALEEGLDCLLLDDQTMDTAWSSLQDVVYSTAKECLGVPKQEAPRLV